MARPALWLALLASLIVGACGRTEPTLYQRLGGSPGVAAVIDEFVDNARTDPRVNQRLQGVNADRTKQALTELLCQDAGGPCTFTGGATGRGAAISAADFNAIAADMAKTLDAFKLPPRERTDVLTWLNSRRGEVARQLSG